MCIPYGMGVLKAGMDSFIGILLFAGMMHLSTALTQQQLDNLANSMSIKATMMGNLRNDAGNHTVKLTVSNTGNAPIPSRDWRLYFHSMYLVQADVFPKNMTMDIDEQKIRLGKVQGDLYYLEPIDGFVPIQQNDIREYYFIAAWWSVARTDFMPYWYLTSDGAAEPRIVTSTNSLDLEYVEPFDDVRAWKRFTGDRYNPYTAQERFRRLATEDTGKVEKLVLPTPKHTEVSADSSTINVDSTWKLYTDEVDFKSTANYLEETIGIQVVNVKPARKVVILRKTANQTMTGAYHLEIDTRKPIIYLTSHDTDGMFYASQSLRSILDGYNKQDIPGIEINDEPRYQYRGMHIDVARNFHTVDDIKRLMTVMAMYKMNKLHLHLSDDEGWRVEIPSLPELTEIGGRRCHDPDERTCVIPQFGSGPFRNSSGSGFYSTAEYKDLLRFAVKNHIQVIPEFDMPGHAHAAIVAMEERYRKMSNDPWDEMEAGEYRLVDPDDKSVYISVQQWLDNAINPCINSTYAFIGKVMDELIELHKDIQPLEIYHFGGDEVAHGAWEMSPACEDLLIANPKYNVTKGIKTYFVEQVSKLAADRNINLAGWEDGFTDGQSDPLSIEDELSTNHTYVYPWNNIWEWGSGKHAYQLANAGYKVILAQATNVYFDHPQEPDPEERGLYWATRFTDTKKVLKFMPDTLYDNIFEERMGKPINKYDICGDNMEKCTALEKEDNILGIQGELWSETVRTSEDLDYMIFPRLLALAERAWYKAEFEGSSDDTRESKFEEEWKMFANTLGYKELRRLDNIGVKYRVPPPAGRVKDDKTVELSSIYPGLGLQRSMDDGKSWSVVQQNIPVVWQDHRTLHVRTVSTQGDRYSRVVEIHKVEPEHWSAQHVVKYIADNVGVDFNVIDNLEKDDGYMRVDIELRNTGPMTIPAGTWRIYQYSLYGCREEVLDCGLRVGHINGGLFYLTPDVNTYNSIPAGGKLSCTLFNKHWLVSRTDNMPNWYVSSLGMAPKVISSTIGDDLSYVGAFSTSEQWKRTTEDKYDPYPKWIRYKMYQEFDQPQRMPYKIVPTPFKVTSDPNSSMKFTSANWKVVESRDFEFESTYLADILEVETSTNVPTNKAIVFVKGDPGEPHTDAYMLDINTTQQKITITANTATGAFYGAQTLISLIEGNNGDLIQMSITDKPRYTYRGIMLDTSRNFKPLEWILKMIDVMAVYKLNKLHFHLSDDEGWRLEMPSIPELTEVGSKRCHSEYAGDCTIPQLGSGPDTSTSGSGFYTVEEYQDILEYANERHIEVIPEIETPGHATAAIVAMNYRESEIDKLRKYGAQNLPESYLLSNPMNKHKAYSPQKWNGNAMDPCLNTSYTFVSKVLDDLIAIHKDKQTLKTIHIGGDEVPEGAWQDSQACSDAGVQPSTHQLQRTFNRRVAEMVANKGLNLAIWDDGAYADDKPNPRDDYQSDNVYAYTWDNRGANTKRVSQFADAGYKVVLPLATHLYFDQRQGPDPEERGLYWSTGFIDTQKAFSLMPDNLFANIDVDRMGNTIDVNAICDNKPCPNPNRTENIEGLEAAMFSETMRTEEHVHYMGFPRILALAERAWHKASWEDVTDVNTRNKQRDADWKEFSDNLGYKELSRLDTRHVSYRLPPPGASIEDNVLKVNTKYPNLLVERSVDEGKSWVTYTDSKLPPGSHMYLLRTRSKTSDVHSRPVKVSVSTVSSATATSISIVLVITARLIDIVMSNFI